ncbi:helix-turn-helix domain-containing protein [Thauera terpenica]|nr:helix-turn-helix transcriptional regulator [Thauera terpenica]
MTGLNRGTLTRLYHETAERLELDVLNELCRYLDCSLGELLEYIPDRTTGDENSSTLASNEE